MNSNYAIYQKGIKKYNNAEYENAICEFQKIFDYKDSAILIDKCQYEIANQCFLDGKIEKSEKILYSIQSLDTTSLQQKIDYSKCLSYIEAKEYMKAYKGLLGINENYILNYNSYQKGDLENLIVTCKSGIAGQGKEYYDKADYLNAYQYFVISFIQNNISYLTEYQACRLINAIQGELYSNSSSNYYSEDTILVNGTTITINSDNCNVKKGTYTTTLQKKINQWDGLEKWALVFDDINAYIELPRNNNLSVYLYSNNSNFSDIYYPKETIEKFRENKLASQPKEPSIGMTHKQVEASTWGKPTKINKTTYSWGTTEQWCYPDYKYIYFDDGYVTAISE